MRQHVKIVHDICETPGSTALIYLWDWSMLSFSTDWAKFYELVQLMDSCFDVWKNNKGQTSPYMDDICGPKANHCIKQRKSTVIF